MPPNCRRKVKQYQKSFKDGEYNLQEPVYTPYGQSIRRYMSGGLKVNLVMPEPGTANSSIVSIPTLPTAISPLSPHNLVISSNDLRTEEAQPLVSASPIALVDIASEIFEKLVGKEERTGTWKWRWTEENQLEKNIYRIWLGDKQIAVLIGELKFNYIYIAEQEYLEPVKTILDNKSIAYKAKKISPPFTHELKMLSGKIQPYGHHM